MPRFWHKFLFCQCDKKVYIDNDNKPEEVIKNIDTKQFSNKLSKAIKDSFDAHLNQLADVNIKNL